MEARLDFGVDEVEKLPRRVGQPDALDVAYSTARPRIVFTGHNIVYQRAILDAPGEHACRVESMGDGRDAIAWPPTCRRFEPHHAAEGCRHPDRSDGIAAEGSWDDPGGHGCSGAARGSARHAIARMRILHLAVSRVVTGQSV